MVNILDGRKEKNFEESTKVLVDVFRSTSTMPIMLARGVPRIIPTSSVKEAKRMKSENPDYIVVGERYGMKIPGFDMTNSPDSALHYDFKGRTAVFTSTNGTLVLKRISAYGKVFVGSFINFHATVDKLRNLDRVDIVVSNRPDGPADEDHIFARFLKSELMGESPEFSHYAEQIRNSKGSRRLKLMLAAKDIESSLLLDYCKKAVAFDGQYIVTEE